MKRIMIAASKSGSGKTIITCALLQILKKNGWKVNSYKCGPDYIDPMFHETIIGVCSKNLDTFFTDEKQTKELFLDSMKNKNFAVFEGVMGLYDGLGGIQKEGSSYHLAQVTKTPIIFVVDVKGMGRSILPLLAGFLHYDKEHLIQGIILNRISTGYYKIIKPLIEKELKVKVIGFLPEKEELQIESRYLGLVMPNERKHIKKRLQTLSEVFLKTVSIDCIIKTAESAEKLKVSPLKKIVVHKKVSIAVAKDAAFCFYYKDNIRMLEENGAKIIYFSPLWDKKLPDNCHALLLGGGYPELYAKQLSENNKMKEAIKKAADNGIPVVAECGGFIYLHSMILDKEGKHYAMSGVINATCFYTEKLVRFGYIEIQEKQSYFLPQGSYIKGHEFHYYDSTYNGIDAVAKKPMTGKKYPCIIENDRQWLGFPHLYYPSNSAFVKSFIEKAQNYKKGTK